MCVENIVPWSPQAEFDDDSATLTQIDVYNFVHKYDSICSI